MAAESIPAAVARQNRKLTEPWPSDPAPPSEALTPNLRSRSDQIAPKTGQRSGTSVLPSPAAKRTQGGR
jgi:hypothetical protein